MVGGNCMGEREGGYWGGVMRFGGRGMGVMVGFGGGKYLDVKVLKGGRGG